jgi:hypothetical protein
MRKAKACVAMLALLLSACSDEGTVNAADVIAVEACPDAACQTGQLVADGATPIPVRISTKSQDRKSDLAAVVRLSSGHFGPLTQIDSTGAATVALASDPTDTLQIIPGQTPGPLIVEASMEGFRAQQTLQLIPATLQAITLVATPATLTGAQANTLSVAAHVGAVAGGLPSAGTTVSFTATAAGDSTAKAVVSPKSVAVDAHGDASTSIAANAGATSITVHAVATAPVNGANPPSTISADLVVGTL